MSVKMRGGPWLKAALLAWLGYYPSAHAQQIVAPIDTGVVPSESNQANQTKGGRSAKLSAWVSITDAPHSPLQLGPFNLRPHVIYRILYSDGLQATPGNPTSTTINSFSPGLLVELGNHWTFDYTPTWNEYTSHDFRDTLDHAARLAWGTTYEGWVLHAFQDYNRTTSALIQTAQQTRETDHLTNINGSYLFASDLISETVLNRSSRAVEGFNDTRDWSILEFLHLKMSPLLDSALGIEYGQIKTSNAPDMYFVQFLARVAYQVSEKISLEIQGGLEDRHIKQAGVENPRGPVGTASIHYQPVEATHLSFNTSRDTTISYFANQIVENSRYGLILEQRLLLHFRLTAGVDYQQAKYRSTLPAFFVARKDKNYSYTLGLRTAVLRHIDLNLQYRKTHNTSNIAGFGFSSDQISMELGYRY